MATVKKLQYIKKCRFYSGRIIQKNTKSFKAIRYSKQVETTSVYKLENTILKFFRLSR
jgi:hypothetical protein